MIFSVRRPQYFLSHTKSQPLLVTRHRLTLLWESLFTSHPRNMSLGHLWSLGTKWPPCDKGPTSSSRQASFIAKKNGRKRRPAISRMGSRTCPGPLCRGSSLPMTALFPRLAFGKRAVVHLSWWKKEILCWASATRVKRVTLSESSLGIAMLHKYVLEYFPQG